eukprot:GCRY01007410.1.p1 GENE.GCRY01007410.1~~GCRY01007410.1.p1  ORF type:complete len:460 (+),score=-8.91 GCRY01007410.1:162-1541(+)
MIDRTCFGSYVRVLDTSELAVVKPFSPVDRREPGKPVKILFDTGAEESLISQKFMNLINAQIIPIRRRLKMANGQIVIATAQARLRIALEDKPVTISGAFTVLPGLINPILVGNDLMRQNGIRLVTSGNERLRRRGDVRTDERMKQGVDSQTRSKNNIYEWLRETEHEEAGSDVTETEVNAGQGDADECKFESMIYEEEVIKKMAWDDLREDDVEEALAGVDGRARRILRKYPKIYSGDLAANKCKIERHSLRLKETAEPFKVNARRCNLAQKAEVESQISELLQQGIIVRSKSAWGAPIVLVKKPNGKFRMCIDYRRLNDVMETETYPIPYFEDTLEKLRGAVIFTTLDLCSGFWQVEMEEKDRHKTAFNTHLGLFEWTRMPFGLKNAATTFQRIMKRVMEGLDDCSQIHIDDVLIFSKSEEQHTRDLGHELNSQRVSLNKEKVDAIARIITPHQRSK